MSATTTAAPAATATTASSQPPAARPYKDFLTPHLHRAFTTAALLSLLLCYLQAALLSPSHSWLWFLSPLGMTGIRTLLLFTSALCVFIVRVMNMHMGSRTTTSPFETVVQSVLHVRTWATLGWYMLSAWIWVEVFIWSRRPEGNLSWVDIGRSYERPRVNENPILLRCVLVGMGAVQAGLHLTRDYDHVEIEEIEQGEGKVQKDADARVPQPLLLLSAQAHTLAGRTMKLALPGLVFLTVIYFALFRSFAWNRLAYPLASFLVRDLPPNDGPAALSHPGQLLGQTVFSSVLMVALWEFSNAAFTITVSQVPLKKGQPLTSEVKDAAGVILSKSRDPNGSLIRGLKAKKSIPRSFAFWELELITSRFDTRRKTIFTEVDRAGGSTWAQISSLCLAELQSVSFRIKTAQEGISTAQTQQAAAAQQQASAGVMPPPQHPPRGLPKIASRHVQNDAEVVQRRAGPIDTIHAIGNMAKAIGQSPEKENPVVKYSSQAITSAWEKVGSELKQQLPTRDQSYLGRLLRSPVGEPFRQPFARRLRSVVLGVPHSAGVNVLHAAAALVRLVVSSLQEDAYGLVAKDVPAIIRVFTATVTDVRGAVEGMQRHWSDVAFRPEQRDLAGNEALREIRNVEEGLRRGLEEVLLAFGEYAVGLGLSPEELREARRVAGAQKRA